MSGTIANFIDDLERAAKVRFQVSTSLGNMAEILDRAETEGERASGCLGLETEIEDLRLASQNLRQGVFRLLVLGDMKRGKSTFLNALIGEKLLPSDVNPCTAVLTVLRYGSEKKVTVHFKDDSRAERLDFETFKKQYTIDPDRAKTLETEKKLAFPNVSHAVVEYPLPFLEKRVEIVDSPGLNDTEALNELSLNYVNNCHAILFVMRAAQPCTLEERRYLENYIKGRGLTVFFLVNAWDEVKKSLIDPEDAEELEEAEARLRKVFQSSLAEHCKLDGQDLYDERVFEISSLEALRRRVGNPDDALEGTGIPEFAAALNVFLTQERAVAETRQARSLARQCYQRTRDGVDRRIPLLDEDLDALKERLESVEPEFEELADIRDRFQSDIQSMRDRKVREIADGFRNYVLELDSTFESDFTRYQPDLGFLEFLRRDERERFQEEFKRAFERYLNEKISAWELIAERDLKAAFAELGRNAESYGTDYARITEAIDEKLLGQKVYADVALEAGEEAPSWSSWAMGFGSLFFGNVAGVALAGIGFDWQNIFVNLIAVLGINISLALFTGTFLGPIGIALVGLGVGALQADQLRKKFLKATQQEFVKYLPQIAQEQQIKVADAVRSAFDNYEREVMKRLDGDIKSRQAELKNVLEQKESRTIDRDEEEHRLRNLQTEIQGELKAVEAAYDYLLAFPSE